jgi:hypothetical protein
MMIMSHLLEDYVSNASGWGIVRAYMYMESLGESGLHINDHAYLAFPFTYIPEHKNRRDSKITPRSQLHSSRVQLSFY